MAAMSREDYFLIEKKETFPKQTNRNRTVILTSNGALTLSVPCIKPQGTHTKTEDIGISYAERWNVIHWRAIESAYNASPYFLYYQDEIKELLLTRHDTLIELNDVILRYLKKTMRFSFEYDYTSDYLKSCEAVIDHRDTYSYKHPERVLTPLPYHQVFNDRMLFNGNVGIMDLLFNLGPESKDYLLSLPL